MSEKLYFVELQYNPILGTILVLKERMPETQNFKNKDFKSNTISNLIKSLQNKKQK